MQVLRVREPFVLEFQDGRRLHVHPTTGLHIVKSSTATIALKSAMEQDRANGLMRGRTAYLRILRRAGHTGTLRSGTLIVSREARRIFKDFAHDGESSWPWQA